MIRLAVRCAPEEAELVLAELTVLAPNGVEEERGPGYVEYAIYGGEGELPELGEIDAVVGEGRIEVSSTEIPDDWADRWRDFHKPLLVGGRLWLRPSWEPPREGAVDLVVDPGRAFGTGAHPTTRLCLELLLELAEAGEAGGELVDLGSGSGVLAIAAAKLGWSPIRAYDHEPLAIEAAAANAAGNDVELHLERLNLRESLPPLAPTVLANMTFPVLAAVASLMVSEPASGVSVLNRDSEVSGETPGGTRRSLPAVAPPSSPRGLAANLRTLVLSGLLPTELDAAATAFAPTGLTESDRRTNGDWAALLLRRP